LLALVLGLAPSSPAVAQESFAEPEKQVHWAMAAVFGTGWYRVDDNRSSFIFRIPPRQTLSEAGWDENGERRIGFEILYPVTLGLHQLDDLPDFIEFDNYSTITFAPGIVVEYPVNERWHLRPFINAGAGYEQTSDEWATVWYTGATSRYTLGSAGRIDWALVNMLYYAAYKPQFKNRGQYGGAMVGMQAEHRLRRLRLFDEPAWLNGHLTYDYYFDNLNFHVSEDEVASIRDTWEVGLALSLGDRRFRFGWFSFEQIGLAYKWSSNGRYRALTFNLRSPFMR
jgi:hypothetical protein